MAAARAVSLVRGLWGLHHELQAVGRQGGNSVITDAHDVAHRPPHSHEPNLPNVGIEGDREVSGYSHAK